MKKMNDKFNSSRRSFLKNMAALSLSPLVVDFVHGDRLIPMKREEGKFVPVMLTPYHADMSIDFDALSRLIDFYEEAGAKGYFANCLSSEMYHLTPPERLSITSHVVKRVAGKAPVVATGSFGESIEEKAEFTRQIGASGVEAVILISSHFVGKEEDDHIFIQNLEQFLLRTDSIPLGSYECPNPYKRIISPEVYAFMVRSGRFIYHKDTSENLEMIEEKLQISANGLLQLYNAHSGSAVASIQAGAAGMSPISGNFYPEVITWIAKNAHRLDRKEDLKWIQSEISHTEPIISKVYPVSAKYFLQLRGLPLQTVSRSSKGVLSEEQRNALAEVHTRFLGWCERLNIKPVTFS